MAAAGRRWNRMTEKRSTFPAEVAASGPRRWREAKRNSLRTSFIAMPQRTFAVTTTGIYLLGTEAAPLATIMYYNFRTSRGTPVYTPKETPESEGSSLTSSRDGRTLLFAQGPFPQSSITMIENFQ